MLSKTYKTITEGKSATGIEILILPEAGYSFRYVTLEKKGTQLIAEKKGEFQDWEDFKVIIDPKIPLYISIHGKGIIHKKIRITGTEQESEILTKALPGANFSDFNYQCVTIGEKEEIVSLVRCSVLEGIIEKFSKQNLVSIHDCFLGPFAINNLLNLIDRDFEIINTTYFSLRINNRLITELLPANPGSDHTEITAGDEKISSELLVAYGSALRHFTGGQNGIINSALLNNIQEENKGKRKFQKTGMLFLVFAFILLLINSFVFSDYWKKNNESLTQLSLSESALKSYYSLKKEFADKKEFIEQNSLLENSRTSFFADRLAQSVPETITLVSLKINPVSKKKNSSAAEQIHFEMKTIDISGKAAKSTDLNEWIKILKKKEWISDLSLLNYNQNTKKESGSFTIRIILS